MNIHVAYIMNKPVIFEAGNLVDSTCHVDWIDPCAKNVAAYDKLHVRIAKSTYQVLLEPLATSALPDKLAWLHQLLPFEYEL